MKKSLLITICFLSVFYGFSQNKKIDSLLGVLQTNIKDTTKVSIYLSISSAYIPIDIDSFLYYTKKTFILSLKNDNYKLTRVYNNMGLACYFKSNIDSAHYYYDEALKMLDKKDDKIIRSTVYGNYSLSFQNIDNFNKKSDYNLKAIELVKGIDREVCLLYFNQAVIYNNAELYKQAKKYCKLAYLSSKIAHDTRVEGAALSLISVLFIEEKKLDSARVYLNKGLELCKKLKSPETCFQINAQLGELYDDLQLYDKANEVYLEAKKNAVFRKNNREIMHISGLLGHHELKRGNYKKAVNYYKEFDEMYVNSPEFVLGIPVYRSWSSTEFKRGNYKKSNELLEKYIILKDSLFSKDNREVLANADAKYETEKKSKELIQQQLQIEQKDKEIQKKKTEYNYMTGIAIFLLLAAIFSWFLFQQRQKRKNQEIVSLKREHQIKTLESLIEGEEKERFRIAKELHDGVNGDLSAIKFKLSSLLDMNNEVIKEAVAMIDKSYEQVRAISHNLIPPSLEDFELIETLDNYCQKIDDNQEVNVTFQYLGDTFILPKKDEINIFRIVQELVSNSIKHAEATEINVQLSNQDNSLQITVDDNGKGFDKDSIKGDGIGLENIQSRIEYLNATVDFSSSDRGTSYIIEIDLDQTL